MFAEDAEAVSQMTASLAAHHGDLSKRECSGLHRSLCWKGKLGIVWIAVNDCCPAGFAATYDWMNFVRGWAVRHIELLFVEESFRHNSIGKALIRTLILHVMRASGCHRVTVGAMIQDDAADNLYRVLGIKPRVDALTRYQLLGETLDYLACK